MKKYNTGITLEKLKRENKIFFSKETVEFHEDVGYLITKEPSGRIVLEVNTKLTNSIARYEVNPNTYQLTYIND